MLSADLSIAVVIVINVILRSSWKLLYRLLYRCRCSSWNTYWSLRGLSSWYRRYMSLVVIVALFRTYELGDSTSNISNKKRVNISSFFITADSVENNLGLNSLDNFFSTLKIIL
jgi:hypothetical protein